MQLQHRFTVPASVDETWALFNDLEAVAPCFPGAALTSAEGDDFAGTVKVKLGPVSLQYSGTGTFVERDEDNHTARFEAKGKDKRGNGTAAAKVTTVLLPDGSGTAVEVSTDLAVTGKPAQFGRGLMQDVSDKLLARFVDCLTDKLTTQDAPPVQPEPAAAGTEPGAETKATGGGTAPAGGTASASGTEPVGGTVAASGTEPAGGTDAVGGTEPGGGTASARESTASGMESSTPTRGVEGTSPDPTEQRATRPRTSRPAEPTAELDLGATVLPVLAKRYGPPALGVLVVLLLLRRLLRR